MTTKLNKNRSREKKDLKGKSLISLWGLFFPKTYFYWSRGHFLGVIQVYYSLLICTETFLGVKYFCFFVNYLIRTFITSLIFTYGVFFHVFVSKNLLGAKKIFFWRQWRTFMPFWRGERHLNIVQYSKYCTVSKKWPYVIF